LLYRKFREARLKVETLEPAASAIDNHITTSIQRGQRSSDDKHVALVHIFEEQVRDSKQVMEDITDKNVIYYYQLGYPTPINEYSHLYLINRYTH
jgi:hypothetical protein